jgi:hypothetical protein
MNKFIDKSLGKWLWLWLPFYALFSLTRELVKRLKSK